MSDNQKQGFFTRLDAAMLDIANAWLRRFQDSTGIPKWKVERFTVGAWGAMAVVEGVIEHRVWMMILGPFILLFSLVTVAERMRQRRADRAMMPIVSEHREGFTMRSLRTLWTFLIIIASVEILRGHWRLSTVREVVVFLTVFLMSCDTWPMIGGSTLKGRIKKVFASKPMVAAKSET